MSYTPKNPNGQATSANSAPVVIASNQTSVPVQLNALQTTVTGTITTSSSVVTMSDLAGIGAVTVSIYGTHAGINVAFEAYDGVNWVSIAAIPISSVTPAPTLTSGVLGSNSTTVWNVSPLLGITQFRVRATAYTSGTGNVRIEPSAQFTQPNVNVGTMPAVTGTVTANLGTGGTGATSLGKAEDAVHASGDTGVASWGVRNDTLLSLTSATGDYSPKAVDTSGIQIVAGAPRLLKAKQFTTITSSTAETTIVTAIASTFNDLYGLVLANTSATATEVTIRDATGGISALRFMVPPTDTLVFTLPLDSAVPQAAVNTNWTAQCTTSVDSLKITALYVKRI